MNQKQTSPWAWFPMALLLSLSAYIAVTEIYSLLLELFLFLPILTGWLASRYGPRTIVLLLAIGVLSAVWFTADVGYLLQLSFGAPPAIYVMSVLSAVAMSKPAFPAIGMPQFNRRWQWLKWLLPILLWLTVFLRHDLYVEFGDWLVLGSNVALVLLLLTLLASINVAALYSKFRATVLADDAGSLKRSRAAAAIVIAAAFFFFVSVVIDLRDFDSELVFSFGYDNVTGVVIVLAFGLVATGAVDWRVVTILLLLFFASDTLVYWLIDVASAGLPATPTSSGTASTTSEALEPVEIIFEGSRIPSGRIWFMPPDGIHALSSVLLATALAPFWQSRDAAAIRTSRSTLFLFLALAVYLAGVAAGGMRVGGTGALIIGGIAFLFGMRWRFRGLVLGPLIIQLGFLVAASLATRGHYDTPSSLVTVGIVAYTFAYFGLLSNRYAPADESRIRRPGVAGARQ